LPGNRTLLTFLWHGNRGAGHERNGKLPHRPLSHSPSPRSPTSSLQRNHRADDDGCPDQRQVTRYVATTRSAASHAVINSSVSKSPSPFLHLSLQCLPR